MKKIIYSKYSNDRSENYKIRTDIVVDENGKRYVVKSPLTEKCKAHMNAMYENYLGLTEVFRDTGIRMNRCEKIGDALEFEYLEGKTYEVYLDELLENEDAEGFIDAVRKYVDVIKSAATEDFVMTDTFRNMFGETPNFDGAKCLKVSDVDMIFPNLLIHKNKENGNEEWQVLDYEWSYRIPIPVDFIIYRAFHYYEAGQRHMRLKEICNLFRLFGMNKETCKTFEAMEAHFQNFLAKGNTPLWQMYHSIGKKLYFPAGEIADQRAESGKRQVHVIKNYKDPNRKAEYFLNPVPENGRISFDIPVDKDIETLVVYPAMRDCAVTVHTIHTVGFETEEVAFLRNGFTLDNKNIYYTSDAPYLLFTSFKEDVSAVHFELTVSYPHKEILYENAELVDKVKKAEQAVNEQVQENRRQNAQYEELKAKYDKQYFVEKDKQAEIDGLKGRLQILEGENGQLRAKQSELIREVQDVSARLDAQQHISNALVNSISWKITKPIRLVKKVFRKLLRRS